MERQHRFAWSCETILNGASSSRAFIDPLALAGVNPDQLGRLRT